MMSIKPKWVKEILNGNKTIEIRKKFPKDYVGWVYIYCTKDKKYANLINRGGFLTGMVVARFWCDKVEEHRPFFHWCIEKETCLTRDDVLDYLDSKDKFVGNPKRQDKVYAVHITKLEIFDKPKEISEFKIDITNTVKWAKDQTNLICKYRRLKTLTRAPQSWCYIEVV